MITNFFALKLVQNHSTWVWVWTFAIWLNGRRKPVISLNQFIKYFHLKHSITNIVRFCINTLWNESQKIVCSLRFQENLQVWKLLITIYSKCIQSKVFAETFFIARWSSCNDWIGLPIEQRAENQYARFRPRFILLATK